MYQGFILDLVVVCAVIVVLIVGMIISRKEPKKKSFNLYHFEGTIVPLIHGRKDRPDYRKELIEANS